MISNENLHAINNVPIVNDFVRCHGFAGVNCRGSYVLYNSTFAIIFFDSLVDNYLEILVLNLKTGTRFDGPTALHGCTESGLLTTEEVRAHRTKSLESEHNIFLSHGKLKAGQLYDAFLALKILFPDLINTSPELAALSDKVDSSWMRPYLACIEAAKNK